MPGSRDRRQPCLSSVRRRADHRSCPPPDRRSARPRTGRAGYFIRPNSSAVMNTFGRDGRHDVSRVPCGRRSARSARRPRRGTPTPRTTRRLPSSSAAGSRPHRPARPRADRRPAASRRAWSLDVGEGARRTAGRRSAHGSRCPGWPAVRLRRGRRGSRASTTPRPRSVLPAQRDVSHERRGTSDSVVMLFSDTENANTAHGERLMVDLEVR